MQELRGALICGSDLPGVLREAVQEVLTAVEKSGQDEKFCVLDYVSKLACERGIDSGSRSTIPDDADTDGCSAARKLVATCDWRADFSLPSDDIYSSAMTAVMDGCLELAAACHLSYARAFNCVLRLGQEQGKRGQGTAVDSSTASSTPQARALHMRALQADLGSSLDRLPDACLAVLRFSLLQARLPAASDVSISAEHQDMDGDHDKKRLAHVEQQLEERAHVLCCAARLSCSALALAARQAIAAWMILREADDKPPPLSMATRSALRAYLLIFRTLAECEQLGTDTTELEGLDAEAWLLQMQQPVSLLQSSCAPSSIIIDAASLAAPSEHELLRIMRLRATAARVHGTSPPHGGSAVAAMDVPPLAFSVHDQGEGVRVAIDLPCILLPCTLRGNPYMGRACSAALAQIDSLARPDEGSPLLTLALQLAHMRTTCQGGASAGADRTEEGESEAWHVRACSLLTFVLLRQVRGRDGARPALLAADVAMQFTACSLPVALALSAHCSSRQLGEGEDAATALRQVALLGSDYVHELLRSLGQSQLQVILPWALPLLLRAWAASSTVDEPGMKAEQHVAYAITLLQSRALHVIFAACCGQGQAVSALHTYLDSFTHKLGLQSSSPAALWRLLSQSLPFWEAAAALHEDHALPADGLTAAVAMRLQPLLRALLEALNRCWHLPVQYLILRILSLLFERQRRDSATGMPLLLRSSAPAVATECLRVLAFYRGPGPGVDLTCAPPDSCLRLEHAAYTLLNLVQSANPSAVDCLLSTVGASLFKESLGDGARRGKAE